MGQLTKLRTVAAGTAAATALALAVAAPPVMATDSTGAPSGNGVAPVFVAGNPTCEDLGYKYEFKEPESGSPPESGVYTVERDGGTGYITLLVSDDNQTFDWSSTWVIDAVIAKGGPNANAYVYEPAATSDTGLHAPIGPSGDYYGLSHISFCFDTPPSSAIPLEVEKTAATTYTRTWNWTIDKSVTPEELDLFTGDSADVDWTVAVTKTGYTDSDWAVSGTITITNPNDVEAASITSVADQMNPGAINATVVCGVTFPYVLPAGQTLNCTYSSALPDATARTNTVIVATTGEVAGGTDDADVMFGAPTTVVNNTINVTDTNGEAWVTDGSTSWTYPGSFTCDADEGTHDNTATITETGQSASASVTVNCHELVVSKDARTSFDRDWTWTIEKTGDQSDLVLAEGQQFLVNYEVTVTATATDSNHKVESVEGIEVYNPAPIAATINAVSDVVSPDIAATVDCGAAVFPYTLNPDAKLICSYSADLPDDADRVNTATATLQNYDYDSAGVGTASGTTDFTGSADVDFANAIISETDACIDVTDDQVGALGTVCADESPKTFSYSMYVGPYEECGIYEFVNVASFETDDGDTGSSSWTVDIVVPCPGCTLTQGYWKTHSAMGPAPYDDGWQMVGPTEEDTTFFLSGKTWYQVFWTAPKGNAYYNLAHQYMAAKLNVLNGASAPASVTAALAWAETFFAANTPGTSLSKPVRMTVLGHASTLDQYNNGLIGPGHCSE